MDNDLHTPIEQLLRSIPKIWGTFDIDSLSQAEQDALARLTAAGLVERRHRMRLRMISRNDGFDATFEATGCCGLIDALGGLLRQAFDEWETDFVAWKKRDDAAPPFVVECIQPSHWRLTTDGVSARSDLDADETARRCVFDFVLRQGIFDGKARLLDNKILHPPHVRGQGRLIACEKISEDARQAAVVNIGNFGPNGETLSQVLEQWFTQKTSTEKPNATATTEPETTATDWGRSDHKATVCRWIRARYLKNGKTNKAEVIRAALAYFGLPADYERRVRTEYDKRHKK